MKKASSNYRLTIYLSLQKRANNLVVPTERYLSRKVVLHQRFELAHPVGCWPFLQRSRALSALCWSLWFLLRGVLKKLTNGNQIEKKRIIYVTRCGPLRVSCGFPSLSLWIFVLIQRCLTPCSSLANNHSTRISSYIVASSITSIPFEDQNFLIGHWCLVDDLNFSFESESLKASLDFGLRIPRTFVASEDSNLEVKKK